MTVVVRWCPIRQAHVRIVVKARVPVVRVLMERALRETSPHLFDESRAPLRAPVQTGHLR